MSEQRKTSGSIRARCVRTRICSASESRRVTCRRFEVNSDRGWSVRRIARIRKSCAVNGYEILQNFLSPRSQEITRLQHRLLRSPTALRDETSCGSLGHPQIFGAYRISQTMDESSSSRRGNDKRDKEQEQRSRPSSASHCCSEGASGPAAVLRPLVSLLPPGLNLRKQSTNVSDVCGLAKVTAS